MSNVNEFASIAFRYSGMISKDFDLTVRRFNAIIRAAFEHIGHYWRRNYLPKHFTVAGAKEYGYSPRRGENVRGSGLAPTNRKDWGGYRHTETASEQMAGSGMPRDWYKFYFWRKLRSGHGRTPLVYSGDLRTRAMRSYRVQATKMHKTGEWRMRVYLLEAQKANLMPRGGNINMRSELTRLSPQEVVTLVDLFNQEFDRLMVAANRQSGVMRPEGRTSASA